MGVRAVLGGIPLGLGVTLIAIAGVGLLRLPDVYNRMNAVAKAASLGLVCVLVGVLVLLPGPRTAAVVGAAVLLQLLTAPVGGFALGRAAHRASMPLAAVTRYDRLAEHRDRRHHPDDCRHHPDDRRRTRGGPATGPGEDGTS